LSGNIYQRYHDKTAFLSEQNSPLLLASAEFQNAAEFEANDK
jgi:hypothetical protein